MMPSIRVKNRQAACEQFAAANGWRCGKHFDLDLLIRNKANHGSNYYASYGEHPQFCDHPEYFRVAGKPIAIVAHNYEYDVMGLRKVIAALGGALVLHEPPACKAASWYYPFNALPMCVTRPDVRKVVWPTHEEMSATAAAYFTEETRQRQADKRWAERNLPCPWA